jgi:glycogen debranching enzyme
MILHNAYVIARKDLSSCCTPDGIVAGTSHFVDMWARDSMFASLGSSERDVNRTIDTFFKFQRKDGAIPYRIFRRGGLLIPNFRSVQSGGFVPDGGLMTVIAAKKFGMKYTKQIHGALIFYKNKFGKKLISEWFQCEWADAVLKMGNVLFTNVLYWKATDSPTIAKKINETFWNGSYFADWVDYKRQDYFASHPNMLAIVWGLATVQQSERILAYAGNTCWNGWALEENYPMYPFWRIPLQNHLSGTADYHNRGCIWLQPVILYAMALAKTGHTREARQVFGKISQKIIEYNGVYEVYEKNGAPVRRLFYRAEQPFAWSAGLFIWAYRTYFTS